MYIFVVYVNNERKYSTRSGATFIPLESLGVCYSGTHVHLEVYRLDPRLPEELYLCRNILELSSTSSTLGFHGYIHWSLFQDKRTHTQMSLVPQLCCRKQHAPVFGNVQDLACLEPTFHQVALERARHRVGVRGQQVQLPDFCRL